MTIKKLSHRQQLIVVVGMHRSGTSAITRALRVMGVDLGSRLMPPVEGVNNKGFYEDLDIVELNEEILRACGKCWHSLEPLQSVDVDYLCEQGYLSRATEMLANKLAVNNFFGFKDPRTSKLMPFWSRVFADGGFDTRFVFSLRNPLSIARSLEERDGLPAEHAYLLWVDSVLNTLSFLHNYPHVIVDYDQLINSPEEELQKVSAFLGKSLDQSKLREYCTDFLEDSLRHSAFSPQDVYSDVAASPLAKDIYRFLDHVQTEQASIEQIIKTGRLELWVKEFHRWGPILRLSDRQFCQRRSLNEALEQVQALKEWATGADAYAKAKVEEVSQLQLQLEVERRAREVERGEALEQVQALKEWATGADAYAKAKVEEVSQLQASLSDLENLIFLYKKHWVYRILPHPKT